MKVVLTGATGFVGAPLLRRLLADGHQATALTRDDGGALPADAARRVVGELGPDLDCGDALDGAEALIHCAARAHIMDDPAADPLAAFRRVNTEGTLALARQAARAGVRRFIFVSSIKVNGEATRPGRPFTAKDIAAPADAYGVSKAEAERGLLALADETGMEVVIVRPVLVYGPGVKANFHSMLRWMQRGVPLPLGAVINRRSLLAIDNLVDLLVTCLDHPAAAGRVFLAADGEDVSTSGLLRAVARALGRPARLIPVPALVLTALAALVGKRDVARRLCDSLQVDITDTTTTLDWVPPVDMDTALRRTAQHFLNKETH